MAYNHAEFVKRMDKHADWDVTDLGGDLVFVVKEIENYDPNYDYLGDWVNSAGEWIVNRRTGKLYGQYIDETYRQRIDPPADSTWGYSAAEEAAEEKKLLVKASAAGFDLDDQHTTWRFEIEPAQADEQPGFYSSLYIEGYRIAATGRPGYLEHGSYEYFQPQYLYGGPNLVTDPDAIKRGMEDWQRMEQMCRSYWYLAMMEGTLYFRGIEIATIEMEWESDYPHAKEMTRMMLDDLEIDMDQVNDRIHDLEEELENLRKFSPDLLKKEAGK